VKALIKGLARQLGIYHSLLRLLDREVPKGALLTRRTPLVEKVEEHDVIAAVAA
jgi:hypothetical protein